MSFWRRALPHWIPGDTPIFVTWRLAGTLPRKSADSCWMDQDAKLDFTQSGPTWLADSAVADVIGQAICFGANSGKYRLHAWVVMSNHVHILITPIADFSETMRWLKWTTARRSNKLLGFTGITFWQDESFDHWIRNSAEFDKVVNYIECNPVAAGLVESPDQWTWSSACK